MFQLSNIKIIATIFFLNLCCSVFGGQDSLQKKINIDTVSIKNLVKDTLIKPKIVEIKDPFFVSKEEAQHYKSIWDSTIYENIKIEDENKKELLKQIYSKQKPLFEITEEISKNPEKYRLASKIHFTIDDGPIQKDIKIAEKAFNSQSVVTFFWVGSNILKKEGVDILKKIPNTNTFKQSIPDWDVFIRKYLDSNKVEIVKAIYCKVLESMPMQYRRINIGYHGIFHPASWNNDEKKTDFKYEYHLRSSNPTLVIDDILFFERIIQIATGDNSYRTDFIRLPGSSTSRAGSEYVDIINSIGKIYIGWDFDTKDYVVKKLDLKDISKKSNNLIKNSKHRPVVLFHSKFFDVNYFNQL